MGETGKHVGIWRNFWLGRSETFIANQLANLGRWTPVTIARERMPDGLDTPLDLLLRPIPQWLRGLLRIVRWKPDIERFCREATKRNLTLLHVHFGNNAATALPFARAAHLPFVVTFHGFDVGKRLDDGSEDSKRRLASLKAVFAEAQVLIAVSDYIAGRLRHLGAPEEKIRVHRIGIPLAPLIADKPRSGVIFVGRLVEKKGVDDLLRAYAALPEGLRREHPLRLVGDGPMRAQLGELATELRLDPQWLGWKSPSEVLALLGESAVFGAPSKTAANGDVEGLGMVFLEAQNQELPIVSYRHGGVPEAVNPGVSALLSDEGDWLGLSKNLAQFLTSRTLRRSFGQAGRQFVHENYDIVRQTAALEDIYDGVLAPAKS